MRWRSNTREKYMLLWLLWKLMLVVIPSLYFLCKYTGNVWTLKSGSIYESKTEKRKKEGSKAVSWVVSCTAFFRMAEHQSITSTLWKENFDTVDMISQLSKDKIFIFNQNCLQNSHYNNYKWFLGNTIDFPWISKTALIDT